MKEKVGEMILMSSRIEASQHKCDLVWKFQDQPAGV